MKVAIPEKLTCGDKWKNFIFNIKFEISFNIN